MLDFVREKKDEVLNRVRERKAELAEKYENIKEFGLLPTIKARLPKIREEIPELEKIGKNEETSEETPEVQKVETEAKEADLTGARLRNLARLCKEEKKTPSHPSRLKQGI